MDNDSFLQSDISVLGGTLNYQPYVLENMRATAELVSGFIYGSAVNYTILPENMQATAVLLNGFIYGNVVSYTILPENMQATAVLLEGTIT